MASERELYLRLTIALAIDNVHKGVGGPFAALVVRDGEVVATGTNSVTSLNDPTAHAEINAIRAACARLGTFQLTGCEIYTSCEPCPMCLGAIYWARPKCFYYAASRRDAAHGEFDDSLIYEELGKPPEARTIPGYRLLAEEGLRPFAEWLTLQHRTPY